jgi:hypothetical protein
LRLDVHLELSLEDRKTPDTGADASGAEGRDIAGRTPLQDGPGLIERDLVVGLFW